MSELNLKQIIDRLNEEFMGDTRKLVFWYDDKGEFAEDVKDKHLEDTLLYSKRFFTDRVSLLSLDLGIDEKYKAVTAINYSCNDDFSSILEQYISFDYKIDQEYRNFYYKFDNLDDTYIFEGLRELVESIYTNEYLNKPIPKWNDTLQEEDVFTKLPLQIDFYDSNVQNAKERTVVIISDAMRYEVGQELYSNLADDPKCMAKLDKQLSVLPSYTRLGMAALLPHDNIIITDNYQVLVDDVLCDNLLGRQTVLQKHSTNSICVQFDDIKNLKKAELRDIFTGKQIIYIYHNQIDARGDKANTYHFIITADHGFIYKRDKVTESDKISGVNDKNAFVNRRFIVADNAVNEDGIASISIGRVLRNKNTKVVSFPISSNVFKVSGGGQNFVHGGSSPQEMLVPVLDVKMERGHMDTKNASIFYGKVKLCVEKFESKKDKEEYYRLKIYTKKKNGSWVYKSEVFRGKQEDIIQEDRVYEIAMFGHLDFTYSNSPKIKLETKDALLYR